MAMKIKPLPEVSGDAREDACLSLQLVPLQESQQPGSDDDEGAAIEWGYAHHPASEAQGRRASAGASFNGAAESSKILEVLGKDMFAEFTAIKVPGTVVWCNFELARELGFDVPPSNRMNDRLHEQLIDALSYKILPTKASAAERQTITMYADKYGGDGVAPALGSARAGFLPYLNLFIKGVGHTPLFRHNDPDDFPHSHGGLNMYAGIIEAIFGEVNKNLFSRQAPRILAIIDQDDYTVRPNGQRVLRAVAARTGNQLRPAHVLAKRVRGERSRLDIFLAMVKATGQIVSRKDAKTGKPVPDLAATMLRIIDNHALTAAEQARWRITHCELSTSNMQMDAAMLDVTTQRANPRSAPLGPPEHYPDLEKAFYTDYIDRLMQMRRLYTALIKATPQGLRESLNARPIPIKEEMDRAYLKHLSLQLLCAVGLKESVARRLQADHKELTQRFTDLLIRMTAVANPCGRASNRLLIQDAAVLDVFQLLREFPRIYFDSPQADHSKEIYDALKPIYKGNRFHLAKKRAVVEELVKEFAARYTELMTSCESFAADDYGDLSDMRQSIISRAAFENRPLELLYKKTYSRTFSEAAVTYKATGDLENLKKAIDRTINTSLRKVDALLMQGESRRLPDNGLETQIRTLDGIRYSVRAWNDQKKSRSLHVTIPLVRDNAGFSLDLTGGSQLSREHIQSLLFEFTVDGWANSQQRWFQMAVDESGQEVITCEISDGFPLVGMLEGAIYVKARRGRKVKLVDCASYLFVIPNRQEVRQLLEGKPVAGVAHG
jgi:hypothetical protein